MDMSLENSDISQETPNPLALSANAFSWRHVLSQLRHASVRDLAFLLLSPPLLHPAHPRWHGAVQAFSEEELRVWRGWLLVQDMVPAALERFLAQAFSENTASLPRLGHYAEHLLAFALSNAPQELGISLLARNVPLRRNNATRDTLGELDFVLERQGHVEHWEMAVKFYLCTGMQSLEDFVSPAALVLPKAEELSHKPKHDTLAYKLAHVFDKQLALQAMLSEADVPEFNFTAPITKSFAYLRGWLFYPGFAAGLSPASAPSAWGLHPQHPHGVWLNQGQTPQLQAGSWIELPRLGWLSPARIVRDRQTRNYPALTFNSSGLDTSLWAQMKKQADGSRQELQRVFVVPE
jgi:uncharacterized protein